MSIEIRHLVVNARVMPQEQEPREIEENGFDLEALRVELLDACQNLIRQLHEQEKER